MNFNTGYNVVTSARYSHWCEIKLVPVEKSVDWNEFAGIGMVFYPGWTVIMPPSNIQGIKNSG